MLRIILVVWATILFSACAQQTSMTLVDRESVGAVGGISFEVSLRDPEAILTEGQKETFVSRARRAALKIFALAGQSKDTVADIEIVVQSHDNRPRWWGTSVPYDITLLAKIRQGDEVNWVAPVSSPSGALQAGGVVEALAEKQAKALAKKF